MPEELIIRKYPLPSQVIFYLLQEIKNDLEYQVYQNFSNKLPTTCKAKEAKKTLSACYNRYIH